MANVKDWENYLETQITEAGLPRPVREYRFLPPRRFRFDFAWVSSKFAVEVDGAIFKIGGHTSGVGYTNDCEKFALATIDGWKIIRVTTGQVNQDLAIDWIKQYFTKQEGWLGA